MTAPKIFIAYSHTDRAWAREFAQSLIEIGLDAWFDEFNIKAGQPLGDALEKGLRDSGVVALLVNAQNVATPNLFFEIGAAFGMKKTIIPIVPDDLDPHLLPLPLQRIKFLLRRSPMETAQELANAVQAEAA